MPSDLDVRQKQRIRRRRFGVSLVAGAAYGVNAAPVAWWKQDTLSGTTNSADVASWTDSSLSGWTVVTDTVAPKFNTGILGGSVDNLVSGGRLKNDSFNSLVGVGAFTCFCVLQMRATAGGGFHGSVDFDATTWYNGTSIAHFSGGVGNFGTYTFADTAAPHVFEHVFDGSQAGNSTRLTAWLDGTTKVLTFTGTIPAATLTGNGYEIGRVYGNASANTSAIAELLVYKTALTPAQRSAIRVALGAKYSISVTP